MLTLKELDRHPSGNYPLQNCVRWLRTLVSDPAVTWNPSQQRAAAQSVMEAEEVLDKRIPWVAPYAAALSDLMARCRDGHELCYQDLVELCPPAQHRPAQWPAASPQQDERVAGAA